MENLVFTRNGNLHLLLRPIALNTAFLGSMLLASTVLISSEDAQADIGATHTALVSEFASFNTPGVMGGRVEAIAIDGDTVYVGGTFTQIQEPLNGETVEQPYLFAYSKSTGDIIRDFDPVLDNNVYALETTGDGTGIFAGGVFGILNGETNRRGLVKIDDNGDRVSGFSARPDAVVKTLVRLDDTLYLGGNFSSISGTAVENLAAVDTTTGDVRPELNLDFDGAISTTRVTGVQGVDDIDITSDGRLMVVIGNFKTIDSMDRVRLGLIELDGTARVSSWNTDIYDVQCPARKVPQYIRGVDIAPDDSYFVIGSQGYRFVGDPACDAISRYELDDLSLTNAQPTWTNYTGGDSVYEVVSTEHAIYAGGHFRWLNNDLSGGDAYGPGSTARAGLAAIDPLNGLTLLNWQSDRNPRGVGVFALIAEDEGLYIGDDTDFLNGSEHKKLKFLPITTDTIYRPESHSLPATVLSPIDGALYGTSFNGTDLTDSAELSSTGWEDLQAAMFVGSQLFFAANDGHMYISNLVDGTFETRERVDLFGLIEEHWAVSQLGGMFFDYDMGRVYYTKQDDSNLFYRAFTPAGPYFGNDEFIADQQSDITWSNVTGMDIIDGYLYFGRYDGNLYRAEVDGVVPVTGTTEAISGPAIDGRNWSNSALTFFNNDSDELLSTSSVGVAEIEFASSGSDSIRRFQRFDFPATAGESVVIRLAWLDPAAILELRILDANGDLVASDVTTNGSPKWLTVLAENSGTYSASVLIREGSTSYTLQINPEEAPPAEPEPLADFEFSSTGSDVNGRWQVFDFHVEAGEFVTAQIIWDNPNADVDVFLRNENNTKVDSITDGSASPALLLDIAETSGEWSVAVRINDGSTDYDVLVDTTTDFEVPEPLADFEFSSNGDSVDGRWQTFKFDVVAGELVTAQISWDDLDADVDVFLRDESNTKFDSITDGSASPAMLSAIAETSGEWSVAVKINSGSVNYDVLVDTTTDYDVPEPLADFEFSSSGDSVDGRWQTFKFDVVAGELVTAQISWDDSNADVDVFLRDESKTKFDSITDGSASPATLSTVAETSGKWTVAVRINSGSVNYDVLVDTTANAGT